MNLDLTNKTALVCGASQGLGYATATELAVLGANLVLVSRSANKLTTAVANLPVNGGQQHHYIAVDLLDGAAVQQVVQQFLSNVQTIHILVNNSGGPAAGPMAETNAAELQNAFGTHLVTSHLLVQLLLPGMRKAGYGRIINILSTSVKQPINGLGISNTVRAAVANWAKTLANEIGFGGITVNNVLPGYTDTDRLAYLFDKQAETQGVTRQTVLDRVLDSIPAKRLGQPHEFGAAVAFLCSPAAAYINGINLPVDGGRTGCL